MKIVLCMNCGHHKKEHSENIGCSPSPFEYAGDAGYFQCECQKFIKDDGVVINLYECDLSSPLGRLSIHAHEIKEQLFCEQLMAVGLL